MSLILLIETSTAVCSVALAQGDRVLAVQHIPEPKSQASRLAPAIQTLLKEQGCALSECDAVAVSAGPGSYTGLRVGVSTAKGLCFGSGKPLIAVNSLDILAQNCIDLLAHNPERLRTFPPHTLIVPMMDARRMEVYTARYQMDGKSLSAPQAMIVGADSFQDILSQGPVIFTGDGAQKCSPLLSHPNTYIEPLFPTAQGMRIAAQRAFQTKHYVDLAYFEPFYLKDF
ncbi:MAG: tRNA (adenosine(37)-N6)-threonylcarbamoyltransferase complex dimerization subunit type 1 TsaB, partial [Bacteroidales bacterium]|nr:tRNA (adenosine(37)-N6)-threonylcarbamoyltransferase complex dimerization subunit type 1 TsaB [Bacteroidales bacterium]